MGDDEPNLDGKVSKRTRLPVPALQGEELLKHRISLRYTHLLMLPGTLSLTNRRVILREPLMWLLGRRARVFDLSEVSAGDSEVPWYLKPYEWFGGVWWLKAKGRRFYFTSAWFSRWTQDIRRAKSKLNE